MEKKLKLLNLNQWMHSDFIDVKKLIRSLILLQSLDI